MEMPKLLKMKQAAEMSAGGLIGTDATAGSGPLRDGFRSVKFSVRGQDSIRDGTRKMSRR